MQFEVNKDDLLKGLQTVQNAISQKSTLPILSNLLLEAGKSNITLTATDLDIGISSKISIKPKEEGAVTIPAKKLLDLIRELPAGENINFVLKKNNMMTIDCADVHFKIIGLPKDEFPALPEFKDVESLGVPQKILKEMLSMTSFAVSRDETRYVLNGVLFVVKKDKLQLVATDGRRLSVMTRPLAEKTGFEKKAIVPSRTVQEIMKILEDGEKEVKIVFNENQIFFDMGDTYIVSRIIDGEFPNYEDVIPKEKSDKVKIDRDSFLAASKRASLFTNQDSLAIKLEITKNKMVVSKNAPYIGESREDLPVSYGGKNISIGFNPAYIIDVLKNMKDADVEMELDETDRPGVIRKNDGFVYVVLPMQLA